MSFKDSAVYKHLQALVSFDTQNPPRLIDENSEIFFYLKENLKGFDFEIIDAGDGCLSLLAVRGKPELLFNFHIDTVPIAQGWTRDPHKLNLDDDKVYALGACDIKGASACMLSAANQTQGDVALLFSSDEEHGSSQAIKKFLQTSYAIGDKAYKKVIVAEPTKAQAVVAHRGIQTATARFVGLPGHASESRALQDNAIHKAGQWISASTEWIASQSQSVEGLTGLPFNIGTINGGVKANMIASDCELKFGFRPLPGQDSQSVLSDLGALSNCPSTKIEPGFFGPCLPAANQDFVEAMDSARRLANELSITIGDAVSFWTEASLFSQAGMTTFVYGPGDIAQAHTADEWVAVEQLKLVEKKYIEILNSK